MSYFYPAQSQTKYHRSPSIPILGFACTTGTVHSPIFQESWLCCLLPSSLLLLSLPLPRNCARRNDRCQCNLARLKPSWSLLLSKSRLKVSRLCVSGVDLVLTLFPQVVKSTFTGHRSSSVVPSMMSTPLRSGSAFQGDLHHWQLLLAVCGYIVQGQVLGWVKSGHHQLPGSHEAEKAQSWCCPQHCLLIVL